MKQTFILLLFLTLIGCNSKPKENEQTDSNQTDSIKTEAISVEVLIEEPKPAKPLYLNGIYEYDYPQDTEDMNENQYIAFQKTEDEVHGWYYGTSDEFDEAREGYLPGYFVSRIDNLTTKGDSIFFSVATGFSQCYSTRFPIGYIDKTKLNEEYEKWFASGEDQVIYYSGKLDGLKLYIEKFGETRTYRKTQNYFHIGIDNYDSTKCQTEPLLAIDQNLDSLNEQMIFKFLSTFSVICEANVEFGEWSNELLFKALSSNPELVLRVLSDNVNNLDTVSIFSELESPIHDLIPIDSITSKVSALEVDKRIKNSVLERLERLK